MLPLTAVWPSGVSATHQTSAMCPFNVSNALWLGTSQHADGSLPLVENRRFPSLVKRSAETQELCPINWPAGLPEAVSNR